MYGKLLLSSLLAGEELNIVYEQELGWMVASAEFVASTPCDRRHEVVRELLGCYIEANHPASGCMMGDRLQEMCLTELGLTMDKERIIVTSGVLRRPTSSSGGHTIAVRDHEVLE